MLNNNSIKEKIKGTLNLHRAIGFVWKGAPGWTVINTALILIQGVLPLLSLYFTKLIVDGVAAGMAAPDKIGAFKEVVILLGIAALVILVETLSTSVSEVTQEQQSLKLSDYMYGIVHSKSVEVDLEYYESPKYFDTLHRAQQEGPYRPGKIVNGLVQLGQNSITLSAMAVLLLSFHWSVICVLFFAVIPGIFVRVRYSKILYQWQRERTQKERKAAYFNWILTGAPHAKEIRIFNLGSLFINWFSDLRKILREEKLKISVRQSVERLAAQAVGGVVMFGVYAFIAYRAVQGFITIGDLVMYYQAFQRGLNSLRQLLTGLASLYEDQLFLSNLYEFLDLKPRITAPLQLHPIPQPMKKGIVFDRVSFKYPGSNRVALDNINLTLNPGQVVAFVGENGAGKTSLIKLLCRLYDPNDGKVTMDGVDLRQFDTIAFRSQISVIFQDYVKYHLTVRDNIWFGNIDMPRDKGQIKRAAQYAGADKVISGLPKGYETMLGKMFGEGEDLSTGEWQKIALSRAFLRNSQIIVLDEPTSSMDIKTEYEIFKKFRQLVKDKTAIIISHRFSTVRMADYVYVLDNGKIIEDGTHDELVSLDGTYASLFEAQAKYFR